jgi:hypothetical protein
MACMIYRSYHQMLGCRIRAYRRLSVLHSVILRPSVARHRSWCPVFGMWLQRRSVFGGFIRPLSRTVSND